MSLEKQAREVQSALVRDGVCKMPDVYALLLGGPRDGDGMGAAAGNPTIRIPTPIEPQASLTDSSLMMDVSTRYGEYRIGSEFVRIQHNLPWCQQSHVVTTYRWEGLS